MTCFNTIKKVKFTSTTGKRISVREIQAEATSGLNVAAAKNGGNAAQSSDKESNTASNAIDSNIVSYSSTNDEAGASLELTFNTEYYLTKLTIHNSWCTDFTDGNSDTCKAYLSFAMIQYIDGNDMVKATTNLGNMTTITDHVITLSSNAGC